MVQKDMLVVAGLIFGGLFAGVMLVISFIQ